MQVSIYVIGNNRIYEQVRHALHDAQGRLTPLNITGKVQYLSDLNEPEDLACFPHAPAVLILDGAQSHLLRRFESIRMRLQSLLLEQAGVAMRPAATLAVMPPLASATLPFQAHWPFGDWLFNDRIEQELALRIASLVRRDATRQYTVQAGTVTLIEETRTMTLGDGSIRLTPSEFGLAEFFFGKFGSIIALRDLTQFFEATGRSCEMNNIRVTIYQLRLKLEIVSKSQLTISTVYRKGYSLRQLAPHSKSHPPSIISPPSPCAVEAAL